MYAINGSIYISKPATLLEKKSFHLPNTVPYYMTRLHSIDINWKEDLLIAQAICEAMHMADGRAWRQVATLS